MKSCLRHLGRAVRRFVVAEEGIESVEWLALAILMASIVLYFGEELLTRIFSDFMVALESVTIG